MQKTIVYGLLSLGIFLGVMTDSSYSSVNNSLSIEVDTRSHQAASDSVTTTVVAIDSVLVTVVTIVTL